MDVVQTAFGAGASGYVVKMDAGRELPTAIDAVLRGDRFVGSRFWGHGLIETSDPQTPGSARDDQLFAQPQRQNIEIVRRHEVGLYSDDTGFLDAFSQFIGAALKAGNVAIVLATESHRDRLLPRLQTLGVDIGAAIEQGRYISLDAAETLSTFMINDLPDPVRFLKVTEDLILTAARAAKGERPRVAACGECSLLLWSQGKAEAAIRLEQLWDEVARSHDIDVLCGYPLGSSRGVDSHFFAKICAAHSAVHSW